MRLQIEGLRRLEIPEDMQRKHGFAELAGPTRLAELKLEYERRGIGRSNRRYGYVARD